MADNAANFENEKRKPHRDRKSGRKAERKKDKKIKENSSVPDKQRNPKAFSFHSAVQAERRFRRKQDLTTKKQHIPLVDRTPLEPPPVIVAVVGPPKVGKTTLVQNLIKHFTRTPLTNVQGPVTVVAGKKQRITFIECDNDINSMIDLAKVADLVLLMVDAAFGFEMEVFEFLNICQVHGMPRVLGVLTHLDLLKNAKSLKKTKKTLKHRFWTEVYAGAKLFYLSGIVHDEYLRNDVKNLARFISVIRFRPLAWRTTHPYLLADRIEDLTPPDTIRRNPKSDRNVALYGYVRGVPLNSSNRVHIPGYGDLQIADVSFLPDPCPMPEKKQRALLEREKTVYAPFSGVQGIVYDKDAVYVHVPGGAKQDKPEEEKDMLESIMATNDTVDVKRDEAELQLFSFSQPIKSRDFEEENATRDFEEVHSDGRLRRRVLFGRSQGDDSEEEGASGEGENSDDDGMEASEDNEESENDKGDSGVEDDKSRSSVVKKKTNKNNIQSKISAALKEIDRRRKDSDSEDEEMAGEDGFESSAVRWKENLAQKAADAFIERQNSSQNLWKLVYGKFKKMWEVDQTGQMEKDDNDEDEIGGIFRVVGEKQKRKQEERERLDEDDNSEFPVPLLRNWMAEENKSLICDCFVTGKWSKSQDAATLLALDDMDDEAMDGDFEDLETGEKHEKGVDGDKTDEAGSNTKKNSREALLAKKQKLKQQFDAEYDEKDDNTYHEDLKMQATRQAQLNKDELEGLPDDLRVELEGYRPGMYVRVELHGVVCEFVEKLDPRKPLIIGGLLPGEDSVGYIQVRAKKHRWYPKLLKNKDPLVISLGWRRFQSLPVFSKLEDNMRLRMLKYSPPHISCMMHFYGPITPQSTGFLAVQTVTNEQPGFRICCTGGVVEINKSTTIVKKLKLIGTPLKIYRKTAFIKGMFNSILEVGKFEGAKLRTVSGIRGIIKKAAGKPEGSFRATFEDKIKLSDIVFCRTWAPVEVPKFYNPVTSLLGSWTAMKTVGQLKRERGIRAEPQLDSLYTPITRKPRTFKPLRVPKRLEAALPYKLKTKTAVKKAKKLEDSRVAVIREPYEEKVATLMKEVRTNFAEKQKKDRLATKERLKKHKKEMQAEDLAKFRRQREAKKQIFRALSKMDKAKEKKMRK